MTVIDWDKAERSEIERYLEHEQGQIRADACCVVGDRLRTKAWSTLPKSLEKLLLERLEDKGPPVRFEAAIALAEAQHKKATPILLEALKTRRLRLDALRALGRGGDEGVREALLYYMHRLFLPWADKLQAAAALAALGDEAGQNYVRKKLSAKRFAERAAAIHFLAESKVPGAFMALSTIAKDTQDKHRDAAVAALALCPQEEALSLLVALQEDSDADFAEYARSQADEWRKHA